MMSRRRKQNNPFAKRTPTNWYARIALILGLIVAAYSSLTSTIANVMVKFDPARAHSIDPQNGKVTAADAEDIFTQHPVADESAPSIRLAQEALRQDPTAVKALAVLGLQAQLRNDTARANQIFAYSTQLSRRDLRTHIWAIEDAVTRGDISGALRHYDIALRTVPDAQPLLFPVLTTALIEPQIRSMVVRILAKNPIWGSNFVLYAATSGVDPEGAMKLFAEAEKAGLKIPPRQRASLVDALFNVGKTDEAWAAYVRLRTDAVRNQSRDPNFELIGNARTLFDWRPGDDPALSAAILNSGKGRGLLDFSVPPSTGGVLVRQTEVLPQGTYRLEGRSRAIEQPSRSQPYWALTCQDGRELGRIPVPNSAQAHGAFLGSFTVPKECTIQTLSLIAVSSDEISGVSGQIIRAQLLPEN